MRADTGTTLHIKFELLLYLCVSMPLFEDPVNFSKSRLKSDLIAHNVPLPPTKSKKEVYLELYLKHIGQKNATDLSSDEEDQVKDMPVS